MLGTVLKQALFGLPTIFLPAHGSLIRTSLSNRPAALQVHWQGSRGARELLRCAVLNLQNHPKPSAGTQSGDSVHQRGKEAAPPNLALKTHSRSDYNVRTSLDLLHSVAVAL